MSAFIDSSNEAFHEKLGMFIDHSSFLWEAVAGVTNVALENVNSNLTQLKVETLPTEYPVLGIALVIAMGAAIFSSGLDAMVKRWFGNEWVNRRFLMYTEVISATIGCIIGGLAGAQIWNPVLGGLCGLVGGASSPFFVKKVNAVFKFWSDRKSK